MWTHLYFTNNYSKHFEFSITTGCTLISVRRQEFSSEEFSESGGVLLLTLWASPGYGLVGDGGTWKQNTTDSLLMGMFSVKLSSQHLWFTRHQKHCTLHYIKCLTWWELCYQFCSSIGDLAHIAIPRFFQKKYHQSHQVRHLMWNALSMTVKNAGALRNVIVWI